ncbi:hypothetical protein HF521_016929 [Silurus meridionalis]|uniref:Uncharacterized protein n=1 Tax=Silurus meridionalis TaxID=175797 RepID=A0A8T0BKS9_SILME|nr:hypothetical protein HF521_016929 [Silurus meridionalis]
MTISLKENRRRVRNEFQMLQSQTPVPQTRRPLIVLYSRRRDVHSSSSTAADETYTHRPLPLQTRRTLIVLYRCRRDVHSSSSTAADETYTHRPLPPQTRRTLIVLYRCRRDIHSSSSKALCDKHKQTNTVA